MGNHDTVAAMCNFVEASNGFKDQPSPSQEDDGPTVIRAMQALQRAVQQQQLEQQKILSVVEEIRNSNQEKFEAVLLHMSQMQEALKRVLSKKINHLSPLPPSTPRRHGHEPDV